MKTPAAAMSQAASFFPLRRAEVAADLEAGDARLRAIMKTSSRSFAPGKTFVVEDRDHPYTYRIRSGWCARVRNLRDGRRQIVALLLPGDLVCAPCAFTSFQTEDIFALDNVTADGIEHERLLEAARDDWSVMLRLSWQLIEDVRRLHNWIVAIGQGSAEERLALLLLDLRGRLLLGGQIEGEGAGFGLPMTQAQIADVLGLTAVHVNRTLRRFREQGIATIERGEVRLHDVGKLYRIGRPLLDVSERSRPEFGGAAGSPSIAFMER